MSNIKIVYGDNELQWEEVSLNEAENGLLSVQANTNETIVLRQWDDNQDAVNARAALITEVSYIVEHKGGVGTVVIDDL